MNSAYRKQNFPGFRNPIDTHGVIATQGKGGGGTWINFSWPVCAAGLSEPLPDYSLFCGQMQTPSKSLLGKCNFRDANLVNFCLCILLIKPFN